MPAKTRHVQVRLDSDEYDAVKRQADAEGIKIQALGYRALMNYVANVAEAKGPEPQFSERHWPIARALARLLATVDARTAEGLATVLNSMLKNEEGRDKEQ